jgi:predicted ATPase
MAYPNAEILQFTEDGIDKVSYRETEHYKITKQFIDTPERMIKYLLSEK